jgi:hypothetical protein
MGLERLCERDVTGLSQSEERALSCAQRPV